MTEAEIIQACLEGQEKGYRELYQRYGSVLLAIAHRYAMDGFSAEDIFQEAFIKIFKKIPEFRGGGSFEGWLKRILINTALNEYKKRNRRMETDLTELVHFDDGQSSAIEQMSANELMSFIEALPEGYRMVFNLFVVEGYDHQEIGEMLGISASTSRSQLVKAKKKLKEVLNEVGVVKSA